MLQTTRLKDLSHDSSSSMSRHLLNFHDPEDAPFHRCAPWSEETGWRDPKSSPRTPHPIRPGAADPVPGEKYGQHLLEDGLRGVESRSKRKAGEPPGTEGRGVALWQLGELGASAPQAWGDL